MSAEAVDLVFSLGAIGSLHQRVKTRLRAVAIRQGCSRGKSAYCDSTAEEVSNHLDRRTRPAAV